MYATCLLDNEVLLLCSFKILPFSNNNGGNTGRNTWLNRRKPRSGAAWASIFEIFSGGGKWKTLVTDRSVLLVCCRIKKSFIVVTLKWHQMPGNACNCFQFFSRTPFPSPLHLRRAWCVLAGTEHGQETRTSGSCNFYTCPWYACWPGSWTSSSILPKCTQKRCIMDNNFWELGLYFFASH